MVSLKNPKKVHGLLPVALALSGNFFITIIKFGGFFVSGSGAMFSEAIHSFADSMNQGLLLVGIKKSTKKADKDFVYGYGQERFLWALISACGIFFIGAGVTIYHGITFLFHPEPITIHRTVFIILGISLIVESFTLWLAYRDLKKNNKNGKLKKILKNGDPSTIAVIYEDSVAVLGVVIAIISIILAEVTGNFYWDAIGSIIIGILLGIVAVTLISKNRLYLIRKSIPTDIQKKIVAFMEADPTIEKVLDFKSSILDIGKYRIKCEVEFNGSALARELYHGRTIREEYDLIKDDYEEFIRFSMEYLDRVPRLIGKKIDEIEKKIHKKFPEVQHIDIEIN